MNPALKIKRAVIVGAVTLYVGIASTAIAMPLTGSGNNLAVPNPNPGSIAGVSAHNADTTGNATAFSTVWSTDVEAPWRGTVTGTGPDPFGPTTGTTNYDFTGLNAGSLAAGAYVFLHDVDQANEVIQARAFDALGNAITQAWLGQAESANLNGNASVAANRTPGWAFTNGQYRFDGTGVASPVGSVNVWLPTLIDVYAIELTRAVVNGRVRVVVPREIIAAVPAPASLAVMLFGLLMIRRSSRRC